jgi:quercetin dioxygenase-like cupin family protein
MDLYKIDFDSLDWQSPMNGVRHKARMHGGKMVRLIEFTAAMPVHWCEKGHYGLILEGDMEIEFDHGTLLFKQGDGVFIPDGAEHRHRARVLTDLVRVIFVEGL